MLKPDLRHNLCMHVDGFVRTCSQPDLRHNRSMCVGVFACTSAQLCPHMYLCRWVGGWTGVDEVVCARACASVKLVIVLLFTKYFFPTDKGG